MGVWSHSAVDLEPRSKCASLPAILDRRCLYCRADLVQLDSGEPFAADPWKMMNPVPLNGGDVDVCPRCGWWCVYQRASAQRHIGHFGAFGVLAQLDLTDLTLPLDEIRTFLLARYERRFELHPRLLETTVASVMADLGYATEVTAYSSDGGIDVILTAPSGTRVGVQVKRYRNKIKAEQIRALMGALMCKDMTNGIFVTTSEFQPGARRAAERATAVGMPIELMNADRFFDALQITNRPMYSTYDEWKQEVGACQLVCFSEEGY